MRKNIVRNIKNGVKYPERFKQACINDFKAGGYSVYRLAKERNISSVTLGIWLDRAGVPRIHVKGVGKLHTKNHRPALAMDTASRAKMVAEERIITMAMANMTIRAGKIVYRQQTFVPHK